jgi:glycine cleavage system H protein
VAAAENYPADLKYHSEHDWARIEGGEAMFGITWKAQDMLGELVFFQPPAVGSTVAKDGAYGEIESVKAVSDLVAPLSGKVIAFNEKVQSEPETINADPYGEGWLVRVELSDPGEAEGLLDVEAYKQLLVEE